MILQRWKSRYAFLQKWTNYGVLFKTKVISDGHGMRWSAGRESFWRGITGSGKIRIFLALRTLLKAFPISKYHNEQIHDNVIGMYIEKYYYKTGTYGNNSS